MTKTTNEIAREASRIAGAIFDDAEGTVAERLLAAIDWRNMGTDCDLTTEDRRQLRDLLDEMALNS